MEWFDFGVYSYIAVTPGKVFFPSGNPTAQLLSIFGAFAAAFLVRPLGGMVFGPLGDRVGRGGLLAIALGMGALGLPLVCFTAAMPATLPALFPTNVRYGSLSLGFNVSVSLFGGTTPLVVTALIGATGDMMMPAYDMMAAAVVGGVAVWFTTKSAGRPLPGSAPSVEA